MIDQADLDRLKAVCGDVISRVEISDPAGIGAPHFSYRGKPPSARIALEIAEAVPKLIAEVERLQRDGELDRVAMVAAANGDAVPVAARLNSPGHRPHNAVKPVSLEEVCGRPNSRSQ